ncbi:hypothetical protein [Corynebacterium sputi]|uniref:hypothetical protein n=1 Tax=Corynebacterium sputi TaxID=489915 RepID=UPI000417DBAA|nr:hypothetical protein [Corynebacterium sputi]
MATEFGNTVWGRAWLRQVEPILTKGGPDRDIPKARSLVRRAVRNVTISRNTVTAYVGDYGQEKTVTLEVPPWSASEMTKVNRIISAVDEADPTDLPNYVADQLNHAGISIAPDISTINAQWEKAYEDDSPTGSVPDGVPPRHVVLALAYSIAQKVDEEPVLAVLLRTPKGRSAAVNKLTRTDLISLEDINTETFYDQPFIEN